MIRRARAGDGEAVARLWLDAAADYVERFPDAFRMPDEDGLAVWLESRIGADDELWLVAEIDRAVAGFVNAHVAPPDPDARWSPLADDAGPRLYVD